MSGIDEVACRAEIRDRDSLTSTWLSGMAAISASAWGTIC